MKSIAFYILPVLPPGTPPSEVTFAKSMSKFCSSGGIVNARNAVLEARSQREAKAAAVVADTADETP